MISKNRITEQIAFVNKNLLKIDKFFQKKKTGDCSPVCAVSRKLLKMIYILLEKGQYYDPNYAVKESHDTGDGSVC